MAYKSYSKSVGKDYPVKSLSLLSCSRDISFPQERLCQHGDFNIWAGIYSPFTLVWQAVENREGATMVDKKWYTDGIRDQWIFGGDWVIVTNCFWKTFRIFITREFLNNNNSNNNFHFLYPYSVPGPVLHEEYHTQFSWQPHEVIIAL